MGARRCVNWCLLSHTSPASGVDISSAAAYSHVTGATWALMQNKEFPIAPTVAPRSADYVPNVPWEIICAICETRLAYAGFYAPAPPP